ncbi:MAG: NUDIX hydrolase [Pseudomonadota bacterium]
MKKSQFPKLAALAVLIRDDSVLLVRRRNPPDAGLWGFPGGHVEPGETAMAAAARELAEETGLRATPVDYITNVDVVEFSAQGELAFHFLLAAVLCVGGDGLPIPQDDVSDAAWQPVNTVLSRTLPTSAQVDDVLGRALTMRDGRTDQTS